MLIIDIGIWLLTRALNNSSPVINGLSTRHTVSVSIHQKDFSVRVALEPHSNTSMQYVVRNRVATIFCAHFNCPRPDKLHKTAFIRTSVCANHFRRRWNRLHLSGVDVPESTIPQFVRANNSNYWLSPRRVRLNRRHVTIINNWMDSLQLQ